ncbi:hypothetical protein K435DRAFT_671619, partial [Dendrothele bispora CBS 962.96]
SLIIGVRTGNILHTTQNAPEPTQESLKRSGPIRSAVLDPTKTHLVTLADDKLLKVWKVDGLELLHERELPKRPTGALFTEDGQTIVVADKFGDVFRFPSLPSTPAPAPALETSTDPSQPEPKKRRRRKPKPHPNPKTDNPPVPRDSLISHASTSGGTLVLGHTSLLTTFLLTKDVKEGFEYVITADRDEHIRVSWFPKGYVIEGFCLGCTQFISALHVPSFAPSVLISGGGDKSLMLWEWLSGKLIGEIPIWEKVEDYMGVKVKPYKGKENGNQKKTREGTEEEEGIEDEDKKMEDMEPVENGGEDQDVDMASLEEKQGEEIEDDEEKVLVVQKISTLETPDGKRWILFSVVGGTAVFLTPFPQSESSTGDIECIDLGKPVLDFVADSQGLVWICVDVNWNPEVTSQAVRLSKIETDGKVSSAFTFYERLVIDWGRPQISEITSGTTPEEVSSLDLYSSLKTLPKRGGGDDDGDGGGDGPAGPEKGKMKSKEAVKKALGNGEAEEERQVKKQKPDQSSHSKE